MIAELQAALTRLGLKKTDARVYLACLRTKGGLYVHEIVDETRIHRSTVDLILARLQSLGYVSCIRIGSRDKYAAQDPEAIILRQEAALADFRALYPHFAGLKGNDGATEVFFFEGKEGIRQVYDDILLHLRKAKGEGRNLLSFSSGQHAIRAFPSMGREFISRRVAMGAWYKAIAPRSSANIREWSNDPASLRAVRFVADKDFPFNISLEIYADSIMLLSALKPVGGTIIRNPRIADSMRALFRLVWNSLPD
jgi:predicted DNA-binding transcriptional regulator